MDNILFKETWIKAPVEVVFKCFTDKNAMLTWHGREAELDPVPGGIYKVVFANGDTILGKFIEIVKNRRVVYFASYGPVRTKVEVDFFNEKDGTRVKIRQTFTPGQDVSTFNMGWDYFLGELRAGIEGGRTGENCKY